MVFESFFPTLVSYVCLVKRGYEYKIKIAELSWEELQGRPWTIALGLAFLLPVPDSYHALLIKEHFVQLQNNKSLSSFWFCSSSHRFVCIVRRRRRIGYTDFWMFAKLSKHPKINFVTSRQLIFWQFISRLWPCELIMIKRQVISWKVNSEWFGLRWTMQTNRCDEEQNQKELRDLLFWSWTNCSLVKRAWYESGKKFSCYQSTCLLCIVIMNKGRM